MESYNLSPMTKEKIFVIAPNLNRRWSGVTSTIFGLLPVQSKVLDIAAFGFNIPKEIRSISFFGILNLSNTHQIVWHSRRNISRYIEKISELRNFSDLNEYSFKKTRHLLEDPVNPAFPKMISKKLLERVYQLWF